MSMYSAQPIYVMKPVVPSLTAHTKEVIQRGTAFPSLLPGQMTCSVVHSNQQEEEEEEEGSTSHVSATTTSDSETESDCSNFEEALTRRSMKLSARKAKNMNKKSKILVHATPTTTPVKSLVDKEVEDEITAFTQTPQEALSLLRESTGHPLIKSVAVPVPVPLTNPLYPKPKVVTFSDVLNGRPPMSSPTFHAADGTSVATTDTPSFISKLRTTDGLSFMKSSIPAAMHAGPYSYKSAGPIATQLGVGIQEHTQQPSSYGEPMNNSDQKEGGVSTPTNFDGIFKSIPEQSASSKTSLAQWIQCKKGSKTSDGDLVVTKVIGTGSPRVAVEDKQTSSTPSTSNVIQTSTPTAVASKRKNTDSENVPKAPKRVRKVKLVLPEKEAEEIPKLVLDQNDNDDDKDAGQQRLGLWTQEVMEQMDDAQEEIRVSKKLVNQETKQKKGLQKVKEKASEELEALKTKVKRRRQSAEAATAATNTTKSLVKSAPAKAATEEEVKIMLDGKPSQAVASVLDRLNSSVAEIKSEDQHSCSRATQSEPSSQMYVDDMIHAIRHIQLPDRAISEFFFGVLDKEQLARIRTFFMFFQLKGSDIPVGVFEGSMDPFAHKE